MRKNQKKRLIQDINKRYKKFSKEEKMMKGINDHGEAYSVPFIDDIRKKKLMNKRKKGK